MTKHFTYYAKKVGFCQWQVWHKYTDGSCDPHNGSKEWKADSNTFYRWMTAARVALSLQCAFNMSEYNTVTDMLDLINAARNIGEYIPTATLPHSLRKRILYLKEQLRHFDEGDNAWMITSEPLIDEKKPL